MRRSSSHTTGRPRGSEKWKRNDTISHAGDLKGTAVCMSSGAPVVDAHDEANYAGEGGELNMFFGLLLETGVLEGTKAFEKALNRADVPNAEGAPSALTRGAPSQIGARAVRS